MSRNTVTAADSTVVATFGQRAAGALVDGVVMLPVAIVAGLWAFEHAGLHTIDSPTFSLLLGAPYAAYEMILTTRWGQTVGKRAVRTRVVPVGSSLTLPSLKAATIRWALKYWTLLYLIAFLGVSMHRLEQLVDLAVIVVTISILTNRYRRGIHDLIARTRVIQVRSDTTTQTSPGTPNWLSR